MLRVGGFEANPAFLSKIFSITFPTCVIRAPTMLPDVSSCNQTRLHPWVFPRQKEFRNKAKI